MIDPEEVRQRIREHVLARYPTQSAAAEAMGMHTGQMSEILRGKRPVPDWLLNEVGLRKQRTWVYMEKAR